MKTSPALGVLFTLPWILPAFASEPVPTTTTAEESAGLDAREEGGIAPSESATSAHPLGWLSDPGAAPKDPIEALVTGKIHLDNRLRLELADTTGRDSSTAITNRIRLGYETKAYHGFSAMIAFDNVSTPDGDNYFVPPTGDGTPSRTVIADPAGTRLNEVYGRFRTDSLADTGVGLEVRGGRQRIKLDDDRFIGNVGWRQFEELFDAVSVRTDLGNDRLSVFYAYAWQVQRIFGPDGPNPDFDSHLINVSYKVAPEITVVPFAYLLDFRGDEPQNSSNNLGLRLTGTLWQDADDASDLYADYELTYAHQWDAGSNPVNYDAEFVAAQVRAHRKGVGFLLAGFQFLGSDNGNFAFRFPLGTNHKFQGFADNFLVTPNAGLQDLHFGVGADLRAAGRRPARDKVRRLLPAPHVVTAQERNRRRKDIAAKDQLRVALEARRDLRAQRRR